MKTPVPVQRASAASVIAGFARFFDIVNGFLIDAVAHCVCGDELHVCTIAFTYR